MEDFRDRKGPEERFRWMGWLYTIVGCFIVALLVLMFLDMADRAGLDQQPPEAYPSVQISQPAISNANP